LAAHPEVDQSLRYIRTLSQRLRGDLASLPPPAWDALSNCPPWPLRRLVAHIVNNGDFIRLSVERGVAGITEPPLSAEERERQVNDLANASPAEMIQELERTTAELERLFDQLRAEDLEALCYHRRGNRSARWYAQHRLIEVAFHYWDFEKSLGREARLDQEVAAFLLPTVLESNLPRIYPSGPRGEGRFCLAIEGAPGSSWLLTASPAGLEVGRGCDGADVTIIATPAVLALLAYGRANLAEEERQNRARVEGDRALAGRFHTIFPAP
jgi:uncharacterized protein (TIGR03083 family)